MIPSKPYQCAVYLTGFSIYQIVQLVEHWEIDYVQLLERVLNMPREDSRGAAHGMSKLGDGT